MGRSSVMRVWLVLYLSIAAVIAPSSQAWAYGTDVHFNLSYVEARLAGIGRTDALWIALADESIDHNRSTSAYSGTIDTMFQFLGLHHYVWARNGQRWQAYTDAGAPNNALDGVLSSTHYADPALARAAVFYRRDELWNRALQELSQVQPNGRITAIRADIAFGQFLHFEQDVYAHRQFGPDLDGQNWVPYGTFRGHSSEGYSPDYVTLRPQLAREMLAATYGYFQQWQQRRGIKVPELSQQMMSSLIGHISIAYDSRSMEYPEHRFRPWYPAQRELNQQLTAALSSNAFAREWANNLPNANDLKLQLPYDQPSLPLRDIERRVGEPVLCSERVPFSAVLTDELLRP